MCYTGPKALNNIFFCEFQLDENFETFNLAQGIRLYLVESYGHQTYELNLLRSSS